MIMKTICLVKKFGPDFPGDKFIEIFVLNQNGSRKATRFSGCYARAWSGLAGTVTRRWGYPRLASRAKPNRVRGESHWRQPERESRSQSPSLTATAPACSCIGPGSYRVSHERLERGTVDTSRRAWTWMTRSLAVARTPSPSHWSPVNAFTVLCRRTRTRSHHYPLGGPWQMKPEAFTPWRQPECY